MKKVQITPRYLRTRQAATYLSIGVSSLRQLAQDGRIPVIKFSDLDHAAWHFAVADLDALMERNKITS